MLPAKYSDGVQLRETQAFGVNPPSSPVALLMQTPGTRWGSNYGLAQANELTKHYKYWNYVAVRPIVNKFAMHKPNVGYVVQNNSKTGTSYQSSGRHYSQREREWLKQSYSAYLQNDQTEIKPVPISHPLVQLFNKVNRIDSWVEFASEWIMYWELCAKSYLWVIPNALGLPGEIYVIPTDWCWPVYNTNGTLWKYEIIPVGYSAVKFDIPPEEVIECKYKSPRSKIDGWGTLHACPLWSDNTDSIENARKMSFDGGPLPDVWVKLNERFANPSDPELARIREKFIDRIQRRRKEPMILPAGAEVGRLSMTSQEMDYPNSATQLRDNSLAAWGTPGIIAGLAHEFTEANAEASQVVFCENTMNPKFCMAASILTEKLAVRYDPRLVCWYHDCRPENARFRLEQMKTAAPFGGVQPDEWRQYLDFPTMDTPQSTTVYVQATMTPLTEDDLPSKEDEPLPAEAPDGSNSAEPPVEDSKVTTNKPNDKNGDEE